tara:strand:+ start:1929 stop:2114 length:186 start_codon:yes stop_codon:yes gene_type:complete
MKREIVSRLYPATTHFDKSWYLQEDCEMGRQMFCEMVDMDYEEALDLGREEFEKMFLEKKN